VLLEPVAALLRLAKGGRTTATVEKLDQALSDALARRTELRPWDLANAARCAAKLTV